MVVVAQIDGTRQRKYCRTPHLGVSLGMVSLRRKFDYQSPSDAHVRRRGYEYSQECALQYP